MSSPNAEINTIVPVLSADAIRLVMPDISYCRYITPAQLSSPTVLTRVHPTAFDKLSPPAPVVDAESTDAPTIIVTERIGQAFSNEPESDIFYANLRPEDEGGDIPGLILKIVDLDLIPRHGNGPSHDFIQSSLAKECDAFSIAASVQGRALPRFAGLFERGSLYCLVFEDAGRALTWEEQCTDSVQREVIEAVKLLHAVDVAPRFDDWRLMRRGADGNIKITTLWEAETLNTLTPEFVKTLEERNDSWIGLSKKELLAKCKESGLRYLEESFLEPM